MADLASLGIVVKTTGVQEAEKQLDQLSKTGAAAEKQAQKVAPAVDAVGKAAARTAPAIKQAALSAGELKNATRQLPAQFTDIFTSLSSGQAPMQVLIQQGGQLKDTFGGIGPAARAMGGYVAGLVSPLTLAAAAVVALGVAWNKAESEAAAFNRALILTGNQAGLTADDLQAMARSLDATTSATQMKASAVLAEVAQTGQFTAEQIELVTRAAIAMEDATGKAIADTVKEFASLKGEPVQAILKLNEAQHFLTEETLNQIEALVDQGRTADATAVAMRAYADAINERAPQITENLTAVQLVLRDIGKTAGEAGDAMVNAFRDADATAQSTIKSVSNLLNAMGPLFGLIGKTGEATFAGYRAKAGQGKGPFVNVIDPRNPASMNIRPPSGGGVVNSQQARDRIEFEKQGLRYLDDQAKKKREIADVEKLIANGTIQRVDGEKRIAQINADYAERAAKRVPRARAVSDRDSGASLLEQVREQIALTEQEAIAGEKLTASDRLRIQMQSLLANEKSKVTAATREALDAGLKELDLAEQYAAQEADYALIVEESNKQQRELAETRERNADAVARQIDDMAFELALMGKSNIERARMIALRQANVSATSAEGQAIAGLAEELVRASEAEYAVNDLKATFADFGAQLIMDLGNAGNAFEDFTKRLQRLAAQMLAEKAIQYLFSMFAGGGWGDGQGMSGTFSFFSGGGYTGPGGKYEPAGIVHKGEVVWSQDDVRRAGGVGAVEGMRLRGYSDGGVVGMYARPSAPQRESGVTLIVQNNGDPMRARTEEGTGPGGERFIKLILDAAEDRVAGSIAGMGKVGRAAQQRFGLSPAGVSRG